MRKREKSDAIEEQPIGPTESDNGEAAEFKVTDRRHWSHGEDDSNGEVAEVEEFEPSRPTMIDEFRGRAEEAERKLQEYIEAYKKFRHEQDQVRQRLNRDVERRVELRFGELVGDLLQTVDTLDLALAHVADVAEAKALADGVRLALDGFLATLERNGVQKVEPNGRPFDPNEAEALRVDPVDSPELDGVVTTTLQAGYRLGDTLVRPARVAVGRFSRPES
jgi:molecular chaperone GrpE